jgi:hypothetical protein
MPVSRKIRIAACLLASGLASGLVAFRSNPEPPAPAPVASPAPPAPELKPAPSTPIAEEKAVLGDEETWDPQWDAMIEKALPNDLVSPKMSHKVAQFCPRFGSISEPDRRAFWAYFFQALAGAEAGLNATADVQHSEPQVAVVDGDSHRMVRAQGLLQLTYEDSRRYGCDFDWKADKHLPPHDRRKTILQPDNNLLCGVSILENQLIDQKKPLMSVSSYWSTLRPGWPGNRVFIKQMKNVPAACGRPRLNVPKRTAPPSRRINVSQTGD